MNVLMCVLGAVVWAGVIVMIARFCAMNRLSEDE